MVDLDETDFVVDIPFDHVGPHENCWVLVVKREGKSVVATKAAKIENMAHHPRKFLVSIPEAVKVEPQYATKKLGLVLVHSHPRGYAVPSKDDYKNLCKPFVCGAVYSPKQNTLAFYNQGVRKYKKIKL